MSDILHLLQRHGALVVFVVALLEQLGAPVPAIPVIIVAGAIAWSAGTPVLPLLLLILAASFIADSLWFLLGRRYGYRILGFLCRISLSPDSCVRKTEGFFDRWGLVSLLFAKFVPGFSLLAPPLAGAAPNASFPLFLIYDLAGALAWGGAALLTGILFHDAIDRVVEALSALGVWAAVLLGALLVLFVAFKWWERHRFYKTLRMARISVDELRARLDGESPLVILDVRSAAAQKANPQRIPGALVLLPDEMEEMLSHVRPEEEIVLYCT